MNINEYNSLLKGLKEAIRASKVSAKTAEKIATPLIAGVNLKRKNIGEKLGINIPSLTFKEYLIMS